MSEGSSCHEPPRPDGCPIVRDNETSSKTGWRPRLPDLVGMTLSRNQYVLIRSMM